jgi:transcription elongation factor GreB
MSRAFVRESDFESMPDLPPLVSPLPPGAKNFLTATGAQRLQVELKDLAEIKRPRLAACAPEDIDAKRELQMLDQRIRYLQHSLRTAEIVQPGDGSGDTVCFGATVTVREKNGTETRYRIVGVDEANPERGDVSWLSPIARALMNARRGDRITFKAPRGAKELEIAAISYEA